MQTSLYDATFGRAGGGNIQIVTRSGTNGLHADLYSYFRNQRLNAANPLNNRKLPATQAQYGASLGGPLTKDKLFYFLNYDQQTRNFPGTAVPGNPTAFFAPLSSGDRFLLELATTSSRKRRASSSWFVSSSAERWRLARRARAARAYVG